MTSRSACFTVFGDWDRDCLNHEDVKCACVQRERCPESGREHYQGFVMFHKPMRYNAMKVLLKNDSVHLEKTKGSPIQAWEYCEKEDTRIDGPWYYGEKPKGAGSRSDIAAAVESLKSGKRMGDLLEESATVVVKYHRGLQYVATLLARPRDPNVAPELVIYWGDSGTGKTRRAIEENPDCYILTKPNGNNTVWFDGYEGQSCVVLDEFYGWIQYDLLLRIIDRYPLKVQTKGGFVEFRATKFVITSNKEWREWYPNIDDKQALERRVREFGHITHFRKMELVDNV